MNSFQMPPSGAKVIYAPGTTQEAAGEILTGSEADGTWAVLVKWKRGRRQAFEAVDEAAFIVGLVKVRS